MKAREPKRNPWEDLGRARKTAYIVMRAEDIEGGAVAAWAALQRYSEADWTELCVGAGQHPASAKTRAAVLEMLAERARGAA